MDEPLSNLDAKLRVQTRAEIARLHQRLGTTMVYVTHDQVEAMTMGQRIAVMSDGPAPAGRHAAGALRHARSNRFVAGFIGSPSMNFVELPRRRRRRPRSTASVHFPVSRTSTGGGPGAGDTRRRGLPAGAPGARRGRGPVGTVQGTADVVEYLGNEELLHVSVDDTDIVAIVDSSHRVQPGDTVTLKLPLGKLHLFATDDNGDALLATAQAA